MKLENHIAYKMLTKPTEMTLEVIEAMHDKEVTAEDLDRYNDVIQAIQPAGNVTYYVTKSVTEKLELLDTKKCMSIEGWKIFKVLPNFKKTYILPELESSYSKYGGSGCLRVVKSDNCLQFIHVTCKFLPPAQRRPNLDSYMYIVLLYIDLDKGELCTHFQSNDGKDLAPMLYSLMCFVELCDNEIKVIEPKEKYGTQKSGKIVNITPFPITIINNNWNITTIRSEGFPVQGHTAIFWTGPGRTIPKLLYIEPYNKEGYTRKAAKLKQS